MHDLLLYWVTHAQFRILCWGSKNWIQFSSQSFYWKCQLSNGNISFSMFFFNSFTCTCFWSPISKREPKKHYFYFIITTLHIMLKEDPFDVPIKLPMCLSVDHASVLTRYSIMYLILNSCSLHSIWLRRVIAQMPKFYDCLA